MICPHTGTAKETNVEGHEGHRGKALNPIFSLKTTGRAAGRSVQSTQPFQVAVHTLNMLELQL